MLDKENIRPAQMVAPTPWPPLALAQDTPQSHPNRGVQWSEGASMALFEIFKPAPQRVIDVSDDYLQAMAVGALRLSSDRVFELPEALLPRPLHSRSKCYPRNTES